MPLTPAPLRMAAAELRFCSASAKRVGSAAELLDELLAAELFELPDVVDEEPVDEFEELVRLEELDDLAALFDGAVG